MALAMSTMRWLPGDWLSTCRLVTMPYSTAITPQAIAIKVRSILFPVGGKCVDKRIGAGLRRQPADWRPLLGVYAAGNRSAPIKGRRSDEEGRGHAAGETASGDYPLAKIQCDVHSQGAPVAARPCRR